MSRQQVRRPPRGQRATRTKRRGPAPKPLQSHDASFFATHVSTKNVAAYVLVVEFLRHDVVRGARAGALGGVQGGVDQGQHGEREYESSPRCGVESGVYTKRESKQKASPLPSPLFRFNPFLLRALRAVAVSSFLWGKDIFSKWEPNQVRSHRTRHPPRAALLAPSPSGRTTEPAPTWLLFAHAPSSAARLRLQARVERPTATLQQTQIVPPNSKPRA